jgi:hypothetical protein
MGGFDFDRLLPVLIFGGVVAFNFLGPWLRRWLQAQQEAAAAAARKRAGQDGAARPRPAPAKRADRRPARQPEDSEVMAATAAAKRAAAAAAAQRAAVAEIGARAAAAPPSRVSPQREVSASARALLSNRHGLRQALVAAAVLGPCRAKQPYDSRE